MTATREVVRDHGVDWFEYDESSEILQIKFMAGEGVHGYKATPEMVQGLREAEQKNLYFLNHIKPKCRRLPGKT